MDPTILAYIAGFLDGDGSIFFQLVRLKDYVWGYQIRCSVAFYQKTTHQDILHWLKHQFEAGYIRHRKTGISDYTIVDPRAVRAILLALKPYVRLKAAHVTLSLEILDELERIGGVSDFLKICHLVDRFRDLNYSKKRTITAAVVEQFLKSRLLLAPVETDPQGESPAVVNSGGAKTPIAIAASGG